MCIFTINLYAVTIGEIRDKLNENYNKITTIRFDMEMVIDAGVHKVTQVFKVISKLPDKFIIETNSMNMDMKIRSDGKMIATSIPALNINDKKTYSEDSDELASFNNLKGYGEYFNKIDFSIKSSDPGGIYELEGIPIAELEEFSELKEKVAKVRMVVNYSHGTMQTLEYINENKEVFYKTTLVNKLVSDVWITESMNIDADIDNAKVITLMKYSKIFVNEDLPDIMFVVK